MIENSKMASAVCTICNLKDTDTDPKCSCIVSHEMAWNIFSDKISWKTLNIPVVIAENGDIIKPELHIMDTDDVKDVKNIKDENTRLGEQDSRIFSEELTYNNAYDNDQNVDQKQFATDRSKPGNIEDTIEEESIEEIPNQLCFRRHRGCPFLSQEYDRFLLEKHEFWTCKYNSYKCGICNLVLKDIRYIDHVTQNHDQTIRDEFIVQKTTRQEDNFVYITCNNEIKDETYFYTIKAHDYKFWLQFEYKLDVIRILLVADMNGHGADHFTCWYKVTFPGVDRSLEGIVYPMTMAELDTYKVPSDWLAHIFIPQSLIGHLTLPQIYNLELVIDNSPYDFDTFK